MSGPVRRWWRQLDADEFNLLLVVTVGAFAFLFGLLVGTTINDSNSRVEETKAFRDRCVAAGGSWYENHSTSEVRCTRPSPGPTGGGR